MAIAYRVEGQERWLLALPNGAVAAVKVSGKGRGPRLATMFFPDECLGEEPEDRWKAVAQRLVSVYAVRSGRQFLAPHPGHVVRRRHETCVDVVFLSSDAWGFRILWQVKWHVYWPAPTGNGLAPWGRSGRHR